MEKPAYIFILFSLRKIKMYAYNITEFGSNRDTNKQRDTETKYRTLDLCRKLDLKLRPRFFWSMNVHSEGS